jgi:catechol-2,3-dioxygenase
MNRRALTMAIAATASLGVLHTPVANSATSETVRSAAPVSTNAEDMTMTQVTFGENSSLHVASSERERVRSFYHEVLGCPITRKTDRADFFKIGSTFYMAVIYDAAAQSDGERTRSIWLELKTDHPAELKEKILKAGAKEIPFWDKDHFYFQAPGGQVFRLISSSEDMSTWQK